MDHCDNCKNNRLEYIKASTSATRDNNTLKEENIRLIARLNQADDLIDSLSRTYDVEYGRGTLSNMVRRYMEER